MCFSVIKYTSLQIVGIIHQHPFKKKKLNQYIHSHEHGMCVYFVQTVMLYAMPANDWEWVEKPTYSKYVYLHLHLHCIRRLYYIKSIIHQA